MFAPEVWLYCGYFSISTVVYLALSSYDIELVSGH